jgi:hypothetical protein
MRLEGHCALSAGFLIAVVGTRSGWLPGSYVQGAPSARGWPQLSGTPTPAGRPGGVGVKLSWPQPGSATG